MTYLKNSYFYQTEKSNSSKILIPLGGQFVDNLDFLQGHTENFDFWPIRLVTFLSQSKGTKTMAQFKECLKIFKSPVTKRTKTISS